MRLLGKTVLIAAIASTPACHDVVAPRQPGTYFLRTIDGRPLPTFFSPIPEAPTVLSGTFSLYGDGHANGTEFRRDMSGNEYFFTVKYRYTIIGNVVQFDFDPPCQGDCMTPPKGTISNSHLLIDFSGGNNDPIYDYQFVPEIDLPHA
jgi:hypothetical protein